MTSLVLKFDGSVAWIGRKSTSGAADEFAVQRDDAGGKRELDRSQDVAPESLGLARDSVTIYWKKGGAPQTASLQ